MPNNPFTDNIFNRNYGGTTKGVADPYVSGYHFIWFDIIPDSVVTNLSTRFPGKQGVYEITKKSGIQRLLAGTCLSVTPPGGRLNKLEFTGLGGIKWTVPGNIDYDTSITIKFLEFQGSPIYKIFRSWVNTIRDYRTGISNITRGKDYSKPAYSAALYYFTTSPNAIDGESINYYACYDGVFPITDPMNLYTSDVENQGKLEIDIEFSLDYIWTEPWVLNKCKTLLTSTFAQGKDYLVSENQRNSPPTE